MGNIGFLVENVEQMLAFLIEFCFFVVFVLDGIVCYLVFKLYFLVYLGINVFGNELF